LASPLFFIGVAVEVFPNGCGAVTAEASQKNQMSSFMLGRFAEFSGSNLVFNQVVHLRNGSGGT
jgi:hypothetical protein